MKNRDYKEFAPGNIYHVFNRGNNKDKIFEDDQDYRVFLFRIGLALGYEPDELNKQSLLSVPFSRIRISETNKNNYKLHSFCLMPNHFHLLIEQNKDESISKFISKVCTSFSMYINKKYNRVGHVFQDKFKAIMIEDDPQLIWTSAYIHMNPIKDGLAKLPGEYEWSSYNDYTTDRQLVITNTDFLKSIFGKSKGFEEETMRAISNKDHVARTALANY
ncbi:MAG: transposase [bacterium]